MHIQHWNIGLFEYASVYPMHIRTFRHSCWN